MMSLEWLPVSAWRSVISVRPPPSGLWPEPPFTAKTARNHRGQLRANPPSIAMPGSRRASAGAEIRTAVRQLSAAELGALKTENERLLKLEQALAEREREVRQREERAGEEVVGEGLAMASVRRQCDVSVTSL